MIRPVRKRFSIYERRSDTKKKFQLTTKAWLIIFAGLIVVLFLVRYGIRTFGGTGKGEKAVIIVDNKIVRTVDLSRDTKFTLDTGYGKNTVTVSNGSISVTEADCPDQICVTHGPLTTDGLPIICLPHLLIIQYEQDAAEVDAVAQ